MHAQVYWTQEVTAAIKSGKGGLDKLVLQLNKQLRDITLLVRGPLSGLERKTLGALCTIDVHARDTVVKMVEVAAYTYFAVHT
jgi:dynein heavy chain, axonemal